MILNDWTHIHTHTQYRNNQKKLFGVSKFNQKQTERKKKIISNTRKWQWWWWIKINPISFHFIIIIIIDDDDHHYYEWCNGQKMECKIQQQQQFSFNFKWIFIMKFMKKLLQTKGLWSQAFSAFIKMIFFLFHQWWWWWWLITWN